MIKQVNPPKLLIRSPQLSDLEAINEVVCASYGKGYPKNLLKGQITNFKEGCYIAEMDGKIVGYCATIILPEDRVLKKHTWREVTGGGYGSTHNSQGEYLYGYEICVHPDYRRYKIGNRFYRKRRDLCDHLNKKGIVFCGRLPNLKKKVASVGSPEKYLESVINKKIRDPVVNFQLRNGFEILGLMPNYLPIDTDSLGYGLHLIWRNARYKTPTKAVGSSARAPDSVRVATVQYQQRRISSFEEFERQVTYFVDVCADYRADFVVFPEFFTLQLLSIENQALAPHKSLLAMCDYEKDVVAMLRRMAMKFNVNIIGGSTPSLQGDEVHNIAHVFLRDGSTYSQSKIHPTPNERYWWNVRGGHEVNMIPTDCGPIGVLICYDAEFPELARHLVDQGVLMIFVPFLTDERQSYCRVRFCAQARAVENQIYVVLSGSCGNLPNVHNIDIHYAQSCILTPCDFAFARDGVAADTTPNVETIAFADLSFQSLLLSRQRGTVRNLLDRRHELYEVTWHDQE
jgi:predicted amidohydrolase/ribosomal protein S18 acetylase RimI-like enzyme